MTTYLFPSGAKVGEITNEGRVPERETNATTPNTTSIRQIKQFQSDSMSINLSSMEKRFVIHSILP